MYIALCHRKQTVPGRNRKQTNERTNEQTLQARDRSLTLSKVTLVLRMGERKKKHEGHGRREITREVWRTKQLSSDSAA